MSSSLVVPRIPLLIRDDYLIEDALELIRILRPNWIEEKRKNGVDIKTKMFSEGITNKLFGMRLATAPLKQMMIIKVYGNQTDLLIDREAEIATFTLLHMKQCGAEMYAIFDNGICYEFIPGENLNMETCRSPLVYPLVAKEMARLHKSIPLKASSTAKGPQVEIWEKLRSFYKINVQILKADATLREKLQNDFGYNVETVKQDIDELEELLEKQGMPVVFCHNDTVLNNVIYNKDDNIIRFIDYEYALPNYGPYDVANHFMEFAGLNQPDYSLCPKKEFRSEWIRQYLSAYGTEGFTQEQFERWVELCFPLSDLYWGLWCIVQNHISAIEFDFFGYAKLRYLKFKEHMKEIRENIYAPE